MSKKVKEAPSGYGKTTAVQDYLRDNLPEGPSLYWWNADEDAPGTSWSRLCGHLQISIQRREKNLLLLAYLS